jgi:hypothetical protein
MKYIPIAKPDYIPPTIPNWLHDVIKAKLTALR